MNKTFRITLIITLVFLLLKNLAMTVLLGDLSSLIPAAIHLILIYLLQINYKHNKVIIALWALFYLVILNGVVAGGKTLVILSGNAWEINMLRYGIDLFLLALGILILCFRKRMEI